MVEYINLIYYGKSYFSPLSNLLKIPESFATGVENIVGQQFPFRNQKMARSNYMEHIKYQYSTWKISNGKEIEPMKLVIFPVCCGAGGIGKTTFVRKSLNTELKEASTLNPNHSNEFLKLLHSCVSTINGELIFRISFSDDILLNEDLNRIEQSLALRLLHQFFKFQENRVLSFTEFRNKFDYSWLYHITLREVIDTIRFFSKIPITSECLMVLHLDETNILMENPPFNNYLKTALQILGRVIMSLQYTFLLCPLTGMSL